MKLKECLKISRHLFGPGAIRYLEWKIEQNGDDEIIADESQLIQLLASIPDDWQPEKTP